MPGSSARPSQSSPPPMASSAQVTAADISRIAGVTRATVSNWRRRHDDFPAPVGGTDSSPLYDLAAVGAWLQARGQASAATPSGELRTVLRLHPEGGSAATRLIPFVLAAARFGSEDAARVGALTDAAIATHAAKAVALLPDAVPVATGAA